MKLRHIFLAFVGIAGIASALVLFSGEPTLAQSSKIDDQGRLVVVVCRQTIHGRFNRHGGIDDSEGPVEKCFTDLNPIFSNYVTKDGRVYWMSKSTYRREPCFRGVMFSNLFSWECWTAKPRQINDVEERYLWLAAQYSPAFRTLEGSEPDRTGWQQEQLAHYAIDQTSVYFKDKKIKGANPQQFSVIFPFGEDEKWAMFKVSQSGDSTFLDGNAIDNVDLSQFRAFTPAP